MLEPPYSRAFDLELGIILERVAFGDKQLRGADAEVGPRPGRRQDRYHEFATRSLGETALLPAGIDPHARSRCRFALRDTLNV